MDDSNTTSSTDLTPLPRDRSQVGPYLGAERQQSEGIIGWFARNHVATNLMMVAIIGAGLWTIWFELKKETMPNRPNDQVSVFVPFRGATPEEVEEGVLLKVEEALSNIEGVAETRSFASEGSGRVQLEVDPGYEVEKVLDEVKLAIDAISSFPSETERPIVRTQGSWNNGVLNVQVYGEVDLQTLRDVAEDIRNRILELPDVTSAELRGAQSSEISIEVSEEVLQRYGLTLNGVANSIRQWSVDIPSGGIRTEGGYMRVRATGQAYTEDDFRDITLITRPDGTLLKLGDIANVIDGYTESTFVALFDGKPSIGISVDANEKEDALLISKQVRGFVDQYKYTLPPTIQVAYFGDSTYYLDDRLQMMLKNMALGAALVFIMLGLFLRLRVAFWVCVGLPVAFLGAFWLLPFVGVTLNMISLFGFIVVIGIVVDDAIIIGEAAYAETEVHGYNTTNIVRGARRVAVPATFGVLTTVAAFAPLLNSTGMLQIMFAPIVWVVIFCLVFSLIESKLILPSHLALMKSSHRRKGPADLINKGLKWFIDRIYLPFLQRALKYRYISMAIFIGVLIVTFGFYGSPYLKKSVFPTFESDFVFIDVEIMDGLPDGMLSDVLEQISVAMVEVNDEVLAEGTIDEPPIKHVFAWTTGETTARLTAELAKPDNRSLTPTSISVRWREKVGELAGVQKLAFEAQQRWFGGSPISFNLAGKNGNELDRAAEALASHLETFDGVFEVRTPISTGPEEIKLSIKPEGVNANLTLSSLARQVRQAFLGVEAQRIQRGEQEFRVIVRYPKDERQSIGNLEAMMVVLPNGTRTPFHSVADYTIERGYGFIERIDGKRTVPVSADVDRSKVTPIQVMTQVNQTFLPQLQQQYPSVTVSGAGELEAQLSGMEYLGIALLIALVSIYALIAIPLRSYLQPLVIMSAIPFGMIGAVVGHVVLGIQFNMASMFGCVALMGVVVNDSLILVHFVNRKFRDEGASLLESILTAGKARFRAILLTSLTTFFGLVPILMETSLQAAIVIPMACSLAFGIIFSTVVTLVMVPCLLRIGGDLRRVRNADEIVDDTFSVDGRTVLVGTGG